MSGSPGPRGTGFPTYKVPTHPPGSGSILSPQSSPTRQFYRHDISLLPIPGLVGTHFLACPYR